MNKNKQTVTDNVFIDGVQIDDSNTEFKQAFSAVENSSNKIIYVTGRAGTGKTFFLKYIRAMIKKNMIVLAPTGVAAINAGGETIHHFFGISFGPFVPNDKRLRLSAGNDEDRSTVYDLFKYDQEKIDIMAGLELLIIDEISMVNCYLLDVIDKLLRIFRKKYNEPFGGVQTLFIGDPFQLPPINKYDEWDILKHFYKSPFFFDSIVYKKNNPLCIELKKIYRQKDVVFIDLLNRIRVGSVTNSDLDFLNSKYDPYFSPPENEKYIILSTHKENVNRINRMKLSELESKMHVFEGKITGLFLENYLPAERTLQLKEGAQVMFVANDIPKYYNGTIGKIKKIEGLQIIIEIDNGITVSVERRTWNNVRYVWDYQEKKIKDELIGRFEQFPLKLAWAITVHKSQGLTFDRVVADLAKAFSPGQVYVALSRCTNFNRLVLKSPVGHKAIKIDAHVLDHIKSNADQMLPFPGT